MDVEEGVEFICKGGFGSEADIDVELRTRFPGLGGTIRTYQAIAVAHRKEFNQTPDVGVRMFLRHAVIKKLEDYFFKKGVYRYAHVTRPLGSTDKGYIYEWALGSDRFSWYYFDGFGRRPLQLDDWNSFISAFDSAGIDLQRDCVDPDDGRTSQNVIHQFLITDPTNPRLNRLWKRIDFGERSIQIDYNKLHRYLIQHEQDIKANLRPGRYDLITLAYEYLTTGGSLEKKDLARLESFVGGYRYSTLNHLNTVGTESSREISLER